MDSTHFLACGPRPPPSQAGTGSFAVGILQALAVALGERLRREWAFSFYSFHCLLSNHFQHQAQFLETVGLSHGPKEGRRGLEPTLSLTGKAQPGDLLLPQIYLFISQTR